MEIQVSLLSTSSFLFHQERAGYYASRLNFGGGLGYP